MEITVSIENKEYLIRFKVDKFSDRTILKIWIDDPYLAKLISDYFEVLILPGYQNTDDIHLPQNLINNGSAIYIVRQICQAQHI